VFGDRDARTPSDVSRRWETIKAEQEQKESALDGVPDALPALLKAARVLSKMRQSGCDPFRGVDPFREARRELGRLERAAGEGEGEEAAEALGVLLLSVAGFGDRIGAGPEEALRRAVWRLSEAFRREEAALKASGRTFADLASAELGAAAERILGAVRGPNT
jgi:XTP/dITP diphosphohydrolase